MFTNKNLFSNACKLVLTTVFKTQKQVVKINNKYAARYKKWYHFHWKYIGIEESWLKFNYNFILVDTKEEACEKLRKWFAEPEVINCC